MPAPVYRHLDVRGALFGISVLEWAPLLLVAWLGMVAHRPNQGLLAAAVMYAALRLAEYGRPEGFVRHLIAWRQRQAMSAGRLSAAARSRAPQFPFAEYECAELRRVQEEMAASRRQGGDDHE